MFVICKLNVNSEQNNMILVRNREHSLRTVPYTFINIGHCISFFISPIVLLKLFYLCGVEKRAFQASVKI